jgi:hypothetical protein
MSKWRDLVEKVKEAHSSGKLPIGTIVDNLDADYRAIYKQLLGEGLTGEIGMAKDRDDSSVWFYLVKKGWR